VKVFFLDIDGVLNNCMAAGVFHESSTDPLCIAILNEGIRRTGAKCVIISTWKDNFNPEVVINLLYERGILADSIVGYTERDSQKEIGIKNYLEKHQEIEKFVIIDDNLELIDESLKNFCVRTVSHEGIQPEDLKKITNLF